MNAARALVAAWLASAPLVLAVSAVLAGYDEHRRRRNTAALDALVAAEAPDVIREAESLLDR